MLNTIDHHIAKARGLRATDLVHPCEGRWVVALHDAATDTYTAMRSTRGQMKTGQVEIAGSLAHVATESSWSSRGAAMRVAVGTYRSVLVSA
jgi:hypothetical protein